MKALSLSLVLVVIAAVMGIGWLVTEISFLASDDEAALNTDLAAYRSLGSALARTLDAYPDSQAFLSRWQQQSEVQISLHDADELPLPDSLRAGFEAGEPLILETEGNVSLHFHLQHANQVMSMVLPADAGREASLQSSLILTLVFYVGVVVAILLWLYPLLRRLQFLRTAAQAFGQGELQSRVGSSRFSYIAGIEREFDNMAERIQSLVADNKLLGQAVSHNLKTPLARLRFGIDALAETGEESKRESYLLHINRDLLEMETLVETLLQYARLDESNIQLQWQRIAVNSFVGHLIEGMGKPGLSLTFEAARTELHIDADANYLAILLNNLLGNARNHARSQIRVSTFPSGNMVVIMIEDDGPGIPMEERAFVVEPFRRGVNSAGRQGHGMGLAIVARIARWFDARLLLEESSALGGAAVSLAFFPPGKERA